MALETDTAGWGEYQRLVLAELERHDALLKELFSRVGQHDIELDRLKDVTGNIKSLTVRIDHLDAQDIAATAVGKYKKWIIGTIVLLVGSILIPILKVIFFPGS